MNVDIAAHDIAKMISEHYIQGCHFDQTNEGQVESLVRDVCELYADTYTQVHKLVSSASFIAKYKLKQ